MHLTNPVPSTAFLSAALLGSNVHCDLWACLYFNWMNLEQQDNGKTRGQVTAFSCSAYQLDADSDRRQQKTSTWSIWYPRLVSCSKSFTLTFTFHCHTLSLAWHTFNFLCQKTETNGIPGTFPPRLVWETPTLESRGTGGGGCNAGTGPPKTR